MKKVTLFILLFFTLHVFADKTPSLKDGVMGQNSEKVKEALANGADPNEQWSSAPALYWAAIQGKADIMKMLIEKGADVNGTGLMGLTPLSGLIQHPKSPEELVKENNEINEKVLKNFTEEKAKEKGWWKESDVSKFSTIEDRCKLLLDAGADPNFLEGNGIVKEWTPFLNAIDKGYYSLVKIMLDSKKADTEFRFHQWSEGVIQFANYSSAGEFEKWDKADAQRWAAVPKFDTPLTYAVEKNNLPLVKMLVEGGVKLNNGKKIIEKDFSYIYFYYKSPLDLSIDKGYKEISDYLKMSGAICYQKH